MMLGRFAAVALVALAGSSLTACVFDLSSSEEAPKPRVRPTEECPERDQANWARMEAYLAANKAKPGWKVTESGLQYRVITQGTGDRNPTWASTVEVRYKGSLIDGTVFDATKDGAPNAQFEAGNVIKGWQEALIMMKEGDKWELVIPSQIAYGCKGRGQTIKSDQVLVFDVELIKIK